MAVLGHLTKLKRGLGLAFDSHFLYNFFDKNVPYLILYQWTKFQSNTLFFSKKKKKKKKKGVIKFLFR